MGARMGIDRDVFAARDDEGPDSASLSDDDSADSAAGDDDSADGAAPGDIWALAGGIDDLEADIDFTCPVAVRLSPDRVHLQLLLEPDARDAGLDLLVSLVREQCHDLGVEIPLAMADVDAYLRACREGVWTTVVSGTPPTPPVDGGVDLLTPISPSTDAAASGRGRRPVRAHEPLARLRYGSPGAPGRDVSGKELPVRTPRAPRLPRGENTYASDDGTTLLAACDGEAALRNLLVQVTPMRILDGDDIAPGLTLYLPEETFVRGSIGAGCTIRAAGNVHVEGDVQSAHLVSLGGSILVGGSVTGDTGQPCDLEAHAHISCGTALHATLRAGADIRLREARFGVLKCGGNVHIRRSIADSLHDVDLHVGGSVMSSAPLPLPPGPAPTVRQHFRVPTTLSGRVAPYGKQPHTFARCTIEDLSAGGARCRVEGRDAPTLQHGAPVHLAFELSDGVPPVVLIGRVARVIVRHVVGVAFVDLMGRDAARLSEYCRELARIHPAALLCAAADRRVYPTTLVDV